MEEEESEAQVEVGDEEAVAPEQDVESAAPGPRRRRLDGVGGARVGGPGRAPGREVPVAGSARTGRDEGQVPVPPTVATPESGVVVVV